MLNFFPVAKNMVRKLKHHEQKLLKKVDLVQWSSDNNIREAKVSKLYCPEFIIVSYFPPTHCFSSLISLIGLVFGFLLELKIGSSIALLWSNTTMQIWFITVVLFMEKF